MFRRDLARMDDEAVMMQAVEALIAEGLERTQIEKALVAYAPVDLDLLADCYVRALRATTQNCGWRKSEAA